MEKLIIKYLTGTIEDEELQTLLDWLEEDKENKKEFFDYKSIYEASRIFPDKKTVDDLWDKIEDEVSEEAAPARNKRFYLKSLLKYAAVALVMVAATSVFFLMNDYKLSTIIENGIAEMGVQDDNNLTALTLTDGTTVKLKKGSVLKIDNDFNARKREVTLNGEAFFAVAHDEEKPFVVKTENQNITVLGTSFNVKDYVGADLTTVSLVEGSVAIDSDNLDIILKPNQQVIMNKRDKTFTLFNLSEEMMSSFASRKYHFKEKSLADILADIEYLFSIDIVVLNNDLSEKKYTGSLSLNQDVESIIKTLNYKHDFTYEIDWKTQKILIK
ncbi:FecR family protein [Dysgonomonas sp. 25]|uniref:FecR family protein n=1 Tax=Dysgonomonas sp. 25 TaxID=2302933 RepID=UPI0013D169EE|nr:FecR domain-containing protein [Dysgonomonas sp. 25]NDV70167.1 DUF4974 domain-containing protein [Dysgonomonas sp. 25]